MKITILIKTPGQPTADDWQRLALYLSGQGDDFQFEGIEELECVFIPEAFMPEEQNTSSLHNEPVWRTTDDSGFKLWLYADGSDSEG